MGDKTSHRRAAKKAVLPVDSDIARERELAVAHLLKVRGMPASARLKLQDQTDAAQLTLNTRHDTVSSVAETSAGSGVFKRLRVTR